MTRNCGLRECKTWIFLTGQENKVRVDTSQAGEGALSVNIRAAGQEVRHSIQVRFNLVFQQMLSKRAIKLAFV